MRSMTMIAMVGGLFTAFFCFGCQPDTDWDGINDDEDNCVEIYNPGQADDDEDGAGDPCDMNTPHHGLDYEGCYISNWPPLHGWGWSDVATKLVQVGDTRLSATLWWPGLGWWIEQGAGQTNGEGVWFMVKDEHNPYLFTTTFVEGTGFDTDGDGLIDEIEGVYTMLECDSPEGSCDFDPWYEYFTEGDWTAVRTADADCDL